ncbi:GNAT family N-acetyltransferase [Clostridium sp. JS66]|uniref:GNAT family N-acetyltransferase n=1 Tax=Clostridium sp. JS66 TaxID=3064705 RepID=UPI00298E35B6|nr:GNAT family N-acetyltransferase [Clostridium sp. JS66]WPC39882.1 GNAT family N-acetyltransferase [Clostridium sp. JS66]
MDYIIRKMEAFEYPFLKDFLYEAIFQRDETNLLPKTIIDEPALKVYIEDFGKKKDDYCLCAEVDKKIVGAVWIRNIVGYGNIDNETPEFSISLFKEFRGYGIGTDLMKEMIKYLRNNGYKKASLSVQKDNYALKMYMSVGFQVINENIEEYIMVNYLS